MATPREQFAASIAGHAADFDLTLDSEQIDGLSDYFDLLTKWNERLHLVAPCSPAEFALRHVLESLLLLKHLPVGARVVDIGSGGGLPIVPCLLIRRDLRATLIEASQRKAVFLRECLRPIRSPDRVKVVAARFEETELPPSDFVTCRALDKFTELLPEMIRRTARDTTLVLFGGPSLRREMGSLLPTTRVEQIPLSRNRFLMIGSKH